MSLRSYRTDYEYFSRLMVTYEKLVKNFKNMPAVIRLQASISCYQHATWGMLGSYLAPNMRDNKLVVHTVDASQAICQQYPLDQLKNVNWRAKGGSSRRHLSISTLVYRAENTQKTIVHDLIIKKYPFFSSRILYKMHILL